MKKTGSFGSRTTPKKTSDTKSSSLSRSTGKLSGPGSAAFNRRSPVVTEGATIATSSVIQAATDPKIKELVMKQQQIFERESMDKRTPRNRETISALFHSLDPGHAHTSPHHASHGQSNLWKHASFGDHVDHPQASESLIPETPERLHAKFSATSPDAHQQQHHHFFHHPNTPGSAVDTVVHPQDGNTVGGQDDDGVSSELTSDATYMTLQRSAVPPHLPTMSEHPLVAGSPAAHTAMSVSAGSPSMRGHQPMHAYMDINAAMLHEHGMAGNGKDLLASPVTQVPGNNAHGLPMPPPLTLPQAASSGIAAEGVTPPTAYHPPQSQFQTQGQGALANLDPSVLDDQSLRTAYLRLLMEMETRGLHSLSLNPSLPGQSGSSAQGPTPAPISHTSSLGSNSNGNIASTGSTAAPSAAARRELQESPSLKLAPSTAHTAVAPHLNPHVNPADIRKNVPRSKSGGSESAFYPNAMFPGASSTAAPASASLSERAAGSGRKTPNSPLMGRYLHSNATGTETRDSLVHEELHWAPEPEEVELRRAFGQHRHPGSPSYPAYSPFPHLAPSAVAMHGQGSHGATHGSAHHNTGNTPTSVAVGSANWSSNATSTTATTTATAVSHGNSSSSNAHTVRPASRCSGVIPQFDHFDIHMRHNCLSTLPQTHSQYMYTHSTATHVNASASSGNAGSAGATNGTAASGSSGTATGAGSGANARSVDLKMPKFVRKFQGTGAGSLGLTVQRYAHVEEGLEEASVTASVEYSLHHAGTGPHSQFHMGQAPGQGPAQGQQNGSAKIRSSTAQGSAKPSNGHTSGSSANGHVNTGTSRSAGHHHPLLSSSSDMDNSIDAVKIAGGLDQLLLPNRRSSKRNSSLIPDEHSAFDDCSLGSMSLNSARSAGKKSAKTR